ncbi:MAG: hypothetical protein IMZ46_17470, partial [Acidobacteria bacterium]|nr:hypothetical protein [Acidobacteriota bacterium]
MVDSPASSEGDQFFDVPGTFSGNDADKEAPESDPGRSQASETPHEEVTAPQNSRGPSHDLPATIEEESEESGIFSDAYEDLSDVEGDGFQSLDAVADSPVRSKIPQKASGKAVASIAKEIGGATTTSGPAQVATDGAHDMGWEQAKAYWRSLSAEKRKELEREAMQDAGEEADLDDSRPAAKPRKKKLTKTEQSAPVEKEAPPTGPAKGADVEKPGRFLRKTLRGSHPAPSEDAAVTQPPPERGMLKSLRSPPPAAPSEAITEGG